MHALFVCQKFVCILLTQGYCSFIFRFLDENNFLEQNNSGSYTLILRSVDLNFKIAFDCKLSRHYYVSSIWYLLKKQQRLIKINENSKLTY